MGIKDFFTPDGPEDLVRVALDAAGAVELINGNPAGAALLIGVGEGLHFLADPKEAIEDLFSKDKGSGKPQGRR